MRLQRALILLGFLLLVVGFVGCADKPEPGPTADEPGPVEVEPLTEQQAIAEIRKLGGSCAFDEEKHVTTVLLNGTRVTDEGLENLAEQTRLQTLFLNDTQVTDVGLDHLQGLANLRYLTLNGTQVTDEGVKKLQEALPDCHISHSY